MKQVNGKKTMKCFMDFVIKWDLKYLIERKKNLKRSVYF